MKAVASFIIKGFSRKRNLEGELSVKGAKNAVLKALAASILFQDYIEIHNAPLIGDVEKMIMLLEDLGVGIERPGIRSFILKSPSRLQTNLDSEVAKSFRSSVVLSGPLLAREGVVAFPHPGGCVIGDRPIDIFLEAFKRMGAKIAVDNNFYTLKAEKLKGAEIFLKIPSVTVTETLMMTAVLIKGITRIYNAACEPEVVALADFLNNSGADIKGCGTHTIEIKGKALLRRGVFKTPPDRIEAGSFAILAALCGKKIKISNCNPSQIRAVLHALQDVGADIKENLTSFVIRAPSRLKPANIKTREYPGFPTDLQAPFSVLLTQAEGSSMVFETVFEGRLNYVSDLVRMGADVVVCDPHRAIINGPASLRGREIEGPDLRAGLAFIIAALTAGGGSVIQNIYNIDRGYEKVEERLNLVGADIKRMG